MSLIYFTGFEELPADIPIGANLGGSSTSDNQGGAMLRARGWIFPASTAAYNTTPLVTVGRNGGQAFNGINIASNSYSPAYSYFAFLYPTGKTVAQMFANGLTFGFAVRTKDNTGNYSADFCIAGIQLYNGATQYTSTGHTIQVYRLFSSTSFYIGSAFTGGQNISSTVTIPDDDFNWHYYEIAFVPRGEGKAQVYLAIDGVIYFTSDTLTLSPSNAAIPVAIGLGRTPGPSASTLKYWDFDDIRINDHTGSTNNEPIYGDFSVMRRKPTTDVSTQWVRVNGGSSNASIVANLDYRAPIQWLKSDLAESTDMYSSTDQIPNTAKKIRAVRMDAYSNRSTLITTRNKALFSNGTTTIEAMTWEPMPVQGTSTLTSANSIFWETNPITSLPFTLADVNNYTFGIKQSS